MSAVELFEFDSQQVRVVLVDGEPWFVLADVCRVLEIANVGNASARLESDMKGVHTADTPGGRQQVTIVSESGLYEVAFLSRKPEAARFRRWITTEVLPSIRKTGSYGVPVFDPTSIDGARALVEAASTALAALAVAQPKAEAWDQLADATGDYSVSEAAKVLARAGIKTGPGRLFEKLADIGWIFRRGGHWVAYQPKVDAGLLAHRAQSHFHPRTGERVVDPPQVRVTVRGLEALRSLLQAPLVLDIPAA